MVNQSLREHKLSDRITIFLEDNGTNWGAKFDGTIIIKPDYFGITLLGDKYLKLTKLESTTKKNPIWVSRYGWSYSIEM